MSDRGKIHGLIERIRIEVVPTFVNTVDQWRWDWPSDEDPEEWFSPLVEAVKELKA